MTGDLDILLAIGLPFDGHDTGDARLGVCRSPIASRKNDGVGSLAGELRLELTVDWKSDGVGSLAGELRLESIMDWEKIGGSLADGLGLEFMVKNPHLLGGFNTERSVLGVGRRVRCFESFGREAET